MVDANPTLSVITFNGNGLNTPIKRQRSRMILKYMIELYAVYKRLYI